ncbi:glycine zipper 2TM domain-containing protein [Ferrigenium sp. UT5]|uniref:glycine zipper 2TM domain-containing protein n=1 Tax=Ferrigenium sp. UT5 TaxID=3242105 RepID=UPI003552BEEB
MNSRLVLALGIVTLLAACASGKSGDVYTRDQVRQIQTYRVGIIEGLHEVRIEGTKTPIGGGAGAVVGGVAGSSVGRGKGSAVAGVLGAVVGGVVGAAAEEGYTREDGIEFAIQLEDGRHISVVQAKSVNDETFAVGDKVRVIDSAGVVRVTH